MIKMSHTDTKIIESVRRREFLSEQANWKELACPQCRDRQIQLVGYLGEPPARWKCRSCNSRFNWEPDASSCIENKESPVGSSLTEKIVQLRGRVDELERANAELVKKINVLEAECRLASEWRQVSIERSIKQ
jgi:hypothetical protein